MQKIKILIVLCVVVCLSACVSAPKPLDITKIKAREISQIHLEAENEIQVNFRKSSNASTTGVIAAGLIGAMIGAAIDSGINSKKEKKAVQDIVMIKSSLSDFNFEGEIKQRISNEFIATVFRENLNINIIEKDDIPKDGFVIGGNYQLSDNFAHLKVNLTTSLNGIEKEPETRIYSVVKNIPGTKTEREENVQLIVKDSSAELKSLISLSIDEALAMINKDFSGQFKYSKDAEEFNFTDGTYPLSGRILEKDNDVTILGYSKAGLTGVYSVPTKIITIKST